MTMHEGFPSAPRKGIEKRASDLSRGSQVIRNGEIRTIESYRQSAGGIEIKFDDNDVALFDIDDTLEVPPAS